LASAHTLLSESRWEGAELAELVRKLLSPYAAEGSSRYRLEGEPIVLSAELATPFGLVLHELATNAAKYGSFSWTGGTILMKWIVRSMNGQRTLEFVWEEHGGPCVGKYLLHSRHAQRLRSALLEYGGSRVVVMVVPWYLAEPKIEEAMSEEELEEPF
jgi:two-component sensor histidine kinase